MQQLNIVKSSNFIISKFLFKLKYRLPENYAQISKYYTPLGYSLSIYKLHPVYVHSFKMGVVDPIGVQPLNILIPNIDIYL